MVYRSDGADSDGHQRLKSDEGSSSTGFPEGSFKKPTGGFKEMKEDK